MNGNFFRCSSVLTNKLHTLNHQLPPSRLPEHCQWTHVTPSHHIHHAFPCPSVPRVYFSQPGLLVCF